MREQCLALPSFPPVVLGDFHPRAVREISQVHFDLYIDSTKYLDIKAHGFSRFLMTGLDDHLGGIALRGRKVSGAGESEKRSSVEQ
jgi:hypothetical protein